MKRRKCPACDGKIKIMTPPRTKRGREVCSENCRKAMDGERSARD